MYSLMAVAVLWLPADPTAINARLMVPMHKFETFSECTAALVQMPPDEEARYVALLKNTFREEIGGRAVAGAAHYSCRKMRRSKP